MSLLCPTPADRLVDPQGRPYFLWDCDLTLDAFEGLLETGSREQRAYLVGKVMRQAKPEDVFTWVTLREIEDLWPDLERYLGRTREFWRWILGEWGVALGAQVATAHEVLVDKLCALLGRSELRDLIDARALLAAGGDLERALRDAPRKDAGFSPLTLAWVLRQLHVVPMAATLGLSGDEAADLARYRDELAAKIAGVAQPGD